MFQVNSVFVITEGALRVDANVSVSRINAPLGTRTELKNIGSTHAVGHAINYEIKRQISILEAGGQIVNETRAWDPICKKTIPMREKEEKHVMYSILFIKLLKGLIIAIFLFQ